MTVESAITKICLVGGSGAGKTTIARLLAEVIKIPYIDFDCVFWDTSQGKFTKNSEERIASETFEISRRPKWIVEGAYDRRFILLFEAADVIVIVDTHLLERCRRLLVRLFKNRLNGEAPVETLSSTAHLIKFTYLFPKRLERVLDDTGLFHKVIHVKSMDELQRKLGYFNNIVSRPAEFHH